MLQSILIGTGTLNRIYLNEIRSDFPSLCSNLSSERNGGSLSRCLLQRFDPIARATKFTEQSAKGHHGNFASRERWLETGAQWNSFCVDSGVKEKQPGRNRVVDTRRSARRGRRRRRVAIRRRQGRRLEGEREAAELRQTTINSCGIVLRVIERGFIRSALSIENVLDPARQRRQEERAEERRGEGVEDQSCVPCVQDRCTHTVASPKGFPFITSTIFIDPLQSNTLHWMRSIFSTEM